MKSITNILTTLVVSFFLLTVGMKNEAEAQCQNGFTYKKVTMTIGGCPWDIEFCFKCGVSDFGKVYLIGATPIPQSPPCIVVPLQTALDYAYGQLANYDFILNELCPNIPALRPCPFQSEQITIVHNICWRMQKILYFGDETIAFSICGGETCDEVATFCYDASTGTVVKTSNYTMTGPPNCGFEENEVDIPDNVGEFSNCFLYHSPCNP